MYTQCLADAQLLMRLTMRCCAGARSLLYGSALGIGGVVLLGTVALRAAGISSPAELRERLQSHAQPLGDSVRETLSPVKARMQVRLCPVWPAAAR